VALNTSQALLKNLLRTRNFLRFTGLTYEEIMTQIVDRLAGDPRFDNVKESSIAMLTFEIFAAVADLVNYGIERRAEESSLDTAKLQSTAIGLARNLAYDVRRPLPAEASIRVRLKGDISGVSAGAVIEIPLFASFSFDGKPFILRRTFRYTLTSSDIGQGSSFTKDITTSEVAASSDDTSISIIQGERKTLRINGTTNIDQVNQPFQKYHIDDASFSNIYGSQDYTEQAITKVGIGTTLEEALYSGDDDDLTYGPYGIDRRSLLNAESINAFDFMTGKTKRICLLRTSKDGNVDLVFGDDKYTAKGLRSVAHSVFVEYLSTLGLTGNKTGIVGEKVTINDSVVVGSADLTSNLEFYLTTNLVNGDSIEENDSISNNAPALFYSLDRLVNAPDYINYLKSLSVPINVRAALAWGEQDEARLQGLDAISKLFNVIIFTCIGALYNISDDTTSTYSPKTSATGLDTAVLDADFDEDKVTSQSYLNVIAKQNVVQQLKLADTLSMSTEYVVAKSKVFPTSSLLGWKTQRANDGYWDSVVLSATYFDVSAEAEATVEVSASFTSATDFGGVAQAIMDQIAVAIPTLSAVSCTYDINANRMHLTCVYTGYDYLTNLQDPMDSTYNSAYSLGLCTSAASWDTVAYNNSIAYSSKVGQVRDLLQKKGMLTVKNVYVSPIVHSMQVTGNIYIRPLADKDDVHRQICNTVYLWANENVNFNTPIDLSTIIDLVKSFPDVSRADIKIWPYAPTPPVGTSAFFDPDTDSRALVVANRDLFKTTLDDLFVNTTYHTITSAANYVAGGMQQMLWNLNSMWLGDITERLFLSQLAKTLYDGLPTATRDSAEFYGILSDIHKDLVWLIRYNLLDSSGNIRDEYTATTVGNSLVTTHVRGGYSLGAEIVKITMNTTALYSA
jgi:hypothetical protein